jgi:hypothetical protein
VVGSIGYEIPLDESQVVDRTLYEDAVDAQDQG